jgi:asparagine synthase (glutamine-hydrolysing)
VLEWLAGQGCADVTRRRPGGKWKVLARGRGEYHTRMCGISGFNFRSERLIGAMNRSLAHRGPDFGDVFLDDRVSLGHRRLSIIDLSPASHQPMADEAADVWLTYNGEIYNFQELRSGLEAEGVRFRSKGDSEVLLQAYRRRGVSFLGELNGMFALGIYDRAAGRLLLARDPFGIKPLYYYWDGETFLFASEIKALLEHDVPRRVHPGALSEFLTFRFTLGPQTIFENVYRLEPGTYLSYDVRERRIVETGRFWRPPEGAEIEGSLDDLARRLKELFLDAVRIRLVADVPLGFFLSGGIDSTAVVAAARELGADVEAFSAGFQTTNELPFARIAAARFARVLHEVPIGDDALGLLDDVVYHMDEPVGDAAFLAVYVLSREASRHVKVVLAGEGADELLAGYDRYKGFVYGSALAGLLPSALARRGARHLGENPARVLRILGEKDATRRYLEVIRLFSREELDQLGVPEAYEAMKRAGANGRFERDPLRAAQLFDLRTLLPNDFFLKADKMTSAFGLEMRVPFLDPRLVDFSLRLPRRAKLRGWNEKYLLKRAFAGALPEAIVRRRKHGFNVPQDAWLRGPLREPLRRMLSERAHGCYDPAPALALLERFQHGRGGYKASFHDAQKLWSLYVFEVWYRRFMC